MLKYENKTILSMPIIKYNKILEKAFKRPVFSSKDMEELPAQYAKKLLHQLSKSGKIRRIERGKYTCLDDPIAVATSISTPSYISLWTAMSLRKLTDQIPFSVEVMTSRKRFNPEINFSGTKIIFYKIGPKMMFGYENIVWKENMRIFVANKEKIVIDAIYTKRIPENEVKKLANGCDIFVLKKYARLTGNKRVIRKVKNLCSHRMK